MLLLSDNNDSCIYNLYQYRGYGGATDTVAYFHNPATVIRQCST